MSSPQYSDDPDTDRLLHIVGWNLERFFGYEPRAARELIAAFRSRYRVFSPEWGDDFFHHEGAFRSAAFMHYSASRGDSMDFGGFHDWFHAQPFAEAQREAQDHFNEMLGGRGWSG